MRRYILLILFMLSAVLSCGRGPAPGSYSPLYKYRNFPLTKIPGISNPLIYEPTWYSNTLKEFKVEKGIIYNRNYVKKSGNQVIHVSNDITNLIYIMPADTNLQFLDANECYIALLNGSNFFVIDRDGITNFKKDVNPKMFVCITANGNSSIFAYAELLEVYSGYLYPEDIQKHELFMFNISNNQTNKLGFAYDIIGFSQNNEKFIFNYFSGMLYNTPSVDFGDRNAYWYYGKTGILACYDMATGQNAVIGDLDFEQSSLGSDFCDVTLGFTEDLKSFYIIEQRCGTYGITPPLIDGREPEEVKGVWRVDISSLGLGE